MLGPDKIFKMMFAQVSEVSSAGRIIAHEVIHRLGHQHLPAMPSSQQTRDAIERGSHIIITAFFRHTGMQCHTDTK